MPLGFRGPKHFPTKDVLVVYGESPTAMLTVIEGMGFEVPEGLKEYARKSEEPVTESWPDPTKN